MAAGSPVKIGDARMGEGSERLVELAPVVGKYAEDGNNGTKVGTVR